MVRFVADCNERLGAVVPGRSIEFERILHRVTWITRRAKSTALVEEGNFNRGSEMAYRVKIKVTNQQGVGAYLHNANFEEPKPLVNAKSPNGSQPILEPGNYSVHVIGEHLPPGTTIVTEISRNDTSHECSGDAEDNGNFYTICFFTLTDTGEIQ